MNIELKSLEEVVEKEIEPVFKRIEKITKHRNRCIENSGNRYNIGFDKKNEAKRK